MKDNLPVEKVLEESVEISDNETRAEKERQNDEQLSELEQEDLFIACFDLIEKLLPNLQKHLRRGVRNAQSVLPLGNGQEVMTFSMLDQRSDTIYLLELEFRTKLSTSNSPIIVRFLIDFEDRSIFN